MPDTVDGWVIAGAIAAALAVFAARVVLLVASCALADAGELALGKAVVLALLALVACSQVAWLYGGVKERLPASDSAMIGPAHAVMAMIVAVAAWVLPAILYKFLLPAPWKKSALVAGLEVLLGSLVAALIAGVVLVVLAGVQVVRRPAQASVAPSPAVHLRLS